MEAVVTPIELIVARSVAVAEEGRSVMVTVFSLTRLSMDSSSDGVSRFVAKSCTEIPCLFRILLSNIFGSLSGA